MPPDRAPAAKAARRGAAADPPQRALSMAGPLLVQQWHTARSHLAVTRRLAQRSGCYWGVPKRRLRAILGVFAFQRRQRNQC